MSATNTAQAATDTTTAAKPTTPEGTGPDGIRLGTTAESAATDAVAAPAAASTAATPAPAAAAERKTPATPAAGQDKVVMVRKDSSGTAQAAAVVAAMAAATSTRGPAVKTPITHYPLVAQATLERNARRLAGKPYAKYLNRSLEIYSDAAEALQGPMPRSCVLSLEDTGRLLEPGHLPHENGWCALEDGAAYASSLTRFPKECTGDMVRWWFWWHAVESERYALWLPHAHLRVTTATATGAAGDRLAAMADRTAPHVRKWLGRTHRVEELLGERRVSAHLRFVDPMQYGLPWDRLRAAGYEAAVCAEVRDGWEPRLKVGDMLHLWRRLSAAEGGGLELRSRYWLGSGVRLDLPLLKGVGLPLDRVAGALGLKRMRGGARTAYDMFLHDQSEFTNLAGFLPQIYGDFLAGRLGDY